MGLSLGLSLTCAPILGRHGSAWSPLSLFASGEKGAWYDPSDLTTLFQDAAGTIPVTGTGQPVGLMRDKSGNGNHMLQGTANYRPTLKQDAAGNGYLDFDGVDDFIRTENWPPGISAGHVAVATNVAVTAGSRVLFVNINPTASYPHFMCYSSTLDYITRDFYAGNPDYYIDGAANIPANRVGLYNQIVGQPHIIDIYPLNMTKFTHLAFSGYPNYYHKGSVYGVLCVGRRLTELEILQTRSWLAVRSGAPKPIFHSIEQSAAGVSL